MDTETDTKHYTDTISETESNNDSSSEDTSDVISENDNCYYDNENTTEEDLIDEDEFNKIQEKNIREIEIPKELRITKPFLTKFEYARLISIRSTQIANGAKSLLLNPHNLTPIEVAKIELENKLIPLIIKRNLPNNTYELWHINELTLNLEFI